MLDAADSLSEPLSLLFMRLRLVMPDRPVVPAALAACVRILICCVVSARLNKPSIKYHRQEDQQQYPGTGAPGYSGNGPFLNAPMPDEWVADVLSLLNIIQHSGVTPQAFYVDLMHHVHKGGDGTSLPNHRPLTLVDVLRMSLASYVAWLI